MGTKKKTSEMVFRLEWRNKSDDGGDKYTLIGMYDTPSTIQNFGIFKSYLLKNSGVTVSANDVKVTYQTDNGKEWVIDSQEWFEIALGAFRLKARLGEVICLRLEKMSGSSATPQMLRKRSNDAETQFNSDSATKKDAPPAWFVDYMKQFKEEVVEEITFAVTANLPKPVNENVPISVVPIQKKVKPESLKKNKKHGVFGDNPVEYCKEVVWKPIKCDRKLEIKLDRLDAKTKKIKEKKQALINKIENVEQRHNVWPQYLAADGSLFVDVASVSQEIIPHMLGGEIYLHTWEIFNSGLLPWTAKTELRQTWGSADLKPSRNIIPCPILGPGEKGTVSVDFLIPEKPGRYESYWNFYKENVRFGHWLSCCVIVDPPISYALENGSSKKQKVEEEKQGVPPGVFDISNEVDTSATEAIPDYGLFHGRNSVAGESGTPSEQMMLFPSGAGSRDEQPSCSICPPGAEQHAGGTNDLLELNRRLQNIAIFEQSPLDEYSTDDFEGFCSACKQKKSNVYGINEKDLIVDLSKKGADVPSVVLTQHSLNVQSDVNVPDEKSNTNATDIEKSDINLIDKEKFLVMSTDKIKSDDNNNNGTGVNNSESISEVASEASDISSGYDIITTPTGEEQDDKSGYVYIMIDGNKLPVPKYILRPDILENAEDAPGPVLTDDENKTLTEENVMDSSVAVAKLEQEISVLEQSVQDTKSLMSHCSAAGTCYSDVNHHSSIMSNSNRLFIFPQDNPGFEVVNPRSETDENVKTEQSVSDDHPPGLILLPTYSWAQADSRYTLADIQSGCNMTPSRYLRTDVYEAPEQSRPVSSQSNATGEVPKFVHNANYQQIPKTERVHVSPGSVSQGPSAPPQAPIQSPVHMLPETLVSGAVNVASSAINTARSVINMIVPQKTDNGKWVDGHWVCHNQESVRAKNIRILTEMGFWDVDLNATLLARYNDDVNRVVTDLIH